MSVVELAKVVFGKADLSRKDVKKLLAEFDRVKSENKELRQRTENLEMIMGSLDTELLTDLAKIQQINPKNNPQEKVKRAAEGSKKQESVEENAKSLLNKILKKLDNYIDDPKK
ncbi:MAG: hypothetical protein EAZ97_00885 [Bacteroidetes bacterium]|nr:MAG: hypothetical protein EAZ97_00885 [Bacteroidota bacterium]